MPNAQELFDAGYTDLISITPPSARIAPNSAIRPDQLGKVPGQLTDNGWVGYDWRSTNTPTQEVLQLWDRQGANIGLRADSFPAVDVDCTDPLLAQYTHQAACRYLGKSVSRVGRAPKLLLPYRTEEPFKRYRLWVGSKNLIEVLGAGQQYLVSGTHPGTGQPYTWPEGLPPAEQLPLVSDTSVDLFIMQLQHELEMLGWTCQTEGSGGAETDRSQIDQARLKGTPKDIIAAMGYIPNDNEHFPTRHDYLRVGYAIKAALGDEDGWPVFEKWAAEWEGNDRFSQNDPETIAADWRRMQPPYEIGAEFIYELAGQFGYNYAGEQFADNIYDTGEREAPSPNAKEDANVIMFSDAHISDQFARAWQHEFKFCDEAGSWMKWSGCKWAYGGEIDATERAGHVCQKWSDQAIHAISNASKAESTAMRLASSNTRNAVVAYARTNPHMRVAMEDLDANAMNLNTPDGLYNLQSGKMGHPNVRRLCARATKVAPDFEATPHRWLQFLDEATRGDQEMVEYLQRIFAYCLTGKKDIHAILFIHGPGGNGKSVFINVIAEILNDYATVAHSSTFLLNKGSDHPTDIAGFVGKRLVYTEEMPERATWDEERLKSMSSAEDITARFMRQDFFKFTPQFKILLSGNHKPQLSSVDNAIQRRMHVIPFINKPSYIDRALPDKLRAEYPAILAWAIAGIPALEEHGLQQPEAVEEETSMYLYDEDDLYQWIIDELIEDKGAVTPVPELWQSWRRWCAKEKITEGSRRGFKNMLRERGYGYGRSRSGTNNRRGIIGLRLPEDAGVEFFD